MSSGSVLPFVRGVDLSGNDFTDSELGRNATDMCNLRWIRMNRANLYRVPKDLDNFSKIEVLSLTHNRLTNLHDIDPPSVPALKVVNVRDNKLRDSSISSDFFKLSDLATLDLSHNDLSKVPEDLKHAGELVVLSLSHNRISSIPGQLLVHCSGLQYLDLSNNLIKSLPPQLRRLEQLATLNIANNPMEHFVFKIIDKIPSITVLNLENSGRTLDNTPHLDTLVNLTDINMSHNDLPRIPEQVYLIDKLRRINFSHNKIRELSSLVDTWSELVTLDLSSNLLTSLHPNICKCVEIKRLFLSDNKLLFEGIPPNINKLVKLEHFIAPRNQLECIPDGLCRCYNLKKLILSSNQLLTLPEAIHHLTLVKLDINGNPNLMMPPKTQETVKSSGAEFYNIDFESELLREGAVVAGTKSMKTAYTRQKERHLKLQKTRRSSITSKKSGDESARKVLKGLADIADYKQQSPDVMSAGAGIEVENETYTPRKLKRWDESLVRPDLDYSSVFPEDTGTLPGLSMWQIEYFSPVMVEEALHGHLYMGDAYIVLRTFFNDDSELDWEIYYWIGRDSSMDKKACAAMHAVNLRNMLGARGRTKREEQGDESDEFEDLFGSQITYIEGGTASGFFIVEDVEPPKCLYRLCGPSNQLMLVSVSLSPSSLNHNHVFILDGDKTIYIWAGGRSKLSERSKGRLIAERMNKLERKNKSAVVSFRAGNESDEFWDIFDGFPDEPITGAPIEENLKTPRLYKAGMGQGYLELPQVEVLNGLEKSLLKLNEVYILDCYTDVFVWIGRRSARLVRAAALRLAQELLSILTRPSYVTVTRVLQGVEPMVFRLRFLDWNDLIAVDYTVSPQALAKRVNEQHNTSVGSTGTPEKKSTKVDISALFQSHKELLTNSAAEELVVYYNSMLKMMRCCIIEGKKFSILPKEEKGHFYSEECYFFLCQYIIENENSSDEESEEDPELQTVVYFWQGVDASNMGWLQFKLGICKQLERAMGPIEIVPMKQQQESFQFLSHFGFKFIIHTGRRNMAMNKSKPALYQVRANNSRLSRRVVQVAEAVPKYLNPYFCHVLKVPFENSAGGIVYIWIGSKTRTEEAIHAEEMGRTMFDTSYSHVVVQEGAEPENFFWVALGGRGQYDQTADYMKSRRLFRCSNEKGYFSISEKTPDFCQGDMSNDDVMLLDNGQEVYLWFGTRCSEIEKKLAIKSTQVYIKHLKSQEELEEETDSKQAPNRKLKISKNGQEPWEFTRCFHGWKPKALK